MQRNDYVKTNMQSKTVNLKDLLIHQGLYSGYSFRGKIKHVPNGSICVIQLKDFEDNYSSIGDDCSLIESDKIKSKYYLEFGDVLFIAKGANNFALVFNSIDDVPTIASSALFVLKINKNLANPDFVAWYINQSKVQNYLKTNESGTYTMSINKTTIEEAPIELPSLEIQTKIATIANLHIKESMISDKLISLNNKLITAQLLNVL